MGRERPRGKKRGIALATSLMLSVLILVFGIALLSSSQKDLFFQRQQQARDRADVLARSGAEHALYLLSQTPSVLDTEVPMDTSTEYPVLASTEFFILEQRQDPITLQMALLIKGEVRQSNGVVLATRTIVVPYGPDNVLNPAEFETQSYAAEL